MNEFYWQLLALLGATLGAAFVGLVIWRLSSTSRLERAGMGALQSLPIYRDRVSKINTELNRARRFHHRLCIGVIRLSNGYVFAEDERASNDARLRFLMMGKFLREELREFDIVTYDSSNDQFIIVLIETTARQAQLLVNRLGKQVRERLGIEIAVGLAEFPYGGLILEDLVLRAAEECLLYEPEALRTPRAVVFN